MKIEPSPFAPGGPIAFYINGKLIVRLEPLDGLNKFDALAFVLHESVPGHHFQSVVSKSRKQLPNFMKYHLYDR